MEIESLGSRGRDETEMAVEGCCCWFGCCSCWLLLIGSDGEIWCCVPAPRAIRVKDAVFVHKEVIWLGLFS